MPAAHPLLVALGHATRELRVEQRLSQEELSHRTGLHRNYIGGIERGERQPTLVAVARLAEGLGLSVSEIVARAEQAL